jgi:hypothetical protein
LGLKVNIALIKWWTMRELNSHDGGANAAGSHYINRPQTVANEGLLGKKKVSEFSRKATE